MRLFDCKMNMMYMYWKMLMILPFSFPAAPCLKSWPDLRV